MVTCTVIGALIENLLDFEEKADKVVGCARGRVTFPSSHVILALLCFHWLV